MGIYLPNNVLYTNLIIGFCNSKNAMLFTDSRGIMKVDNGYLVYDNCKKLFRINNRLIIAASGKFFHDEMINEPFKDSFYSDLNIDGACELIQEYFLDMKALEKIMMERTYVLCGYDNQNNICIVYIRYNEDTDEIEEQRYYGSDSDRIVAIYPPMLQIKGEDLNNLLSEYLIASNGTLPEREVIYFIEKLSEESVLLNNNVGYLKI